MGQGTSKPAIGREVCMEDMGTCEFTCDYADSARVKVWNAAAADDMRALMAAHFCCQAETGTAAKEAGALPTSQTPYNNNGIPTALRAPEHPQPHCLYFAPTCAYNDCTTRARELHNAAVLPPTVYVVCQRPSKYTFEAALPITYNLIHQAVQQQAALLPTSHLAALVEKEGYEVVFTGSGPAASIAAMGALQLLGRLSSDDLKQKVRFIGLGTFPFIDPGHAASLMKEYRGAFTNYLLPEDAAPRMHQLMMQLIRLLQEQQKAQRKGPGATLTHLYGTALHALYHQVSGGDGPIEAEDAEAETLGALDGLVTSSKWGLTPQEQKDVLTLLEASSPDMHLGLVEAAKALVRFLCARGTGTLCYGLLGTVCQLTRNVTISNIGEDQVEMDVTLGAGKLPHEDLKRAVNFAAYMSSSAGDAGHMGPSQYNEALRDRLMHAISYRPCADGMGTGREAVPAAFRLGVLEPPYGQLLDVTGGDVRIVLQGGLGLLAVDFAESQGITFTLKGRRQCTPSKQARQQLQQQHRVLPEGLVVLWAAGCLPDAMLKKGFALTVKSIYQEVEDLVVEISPPVQCDQQDKPFAAHIAKAGVPELYQRVLTAAYFTGAKSVRARELRSAIYSRDKWLAELPQCRELLELLNTALLADPAALPRSNNDPALALIREIASSLEFLPPPTWEHVELLQVCVQARLEKEADVREELTRLEQQLAEVVEEDRQRLLVRERVLQNVAAVAPHMKLIDVVASSLFSSSTARQVAGSILPRGDEWETELMGLLDCEDETPSAVLKSARPYITATAVSGSLLHHEYSYRRKVLGADGAAYFCISSPLERLIAAVLVVNPWASAAIQLGGCAALAYSVAYHKRAGNMVERTSQSTALQQEMYEDLLEYLLWDMFQVGKDDVAGLLELGKKLGATSRLEAEVYRQVTLRVLPSQPDSAEELHAPAPEQLKRWVEVCFSKVVGNISFLSRGPDEVLKSMLLFVCNNHLIRIALTKRIYIGILGASKVGKSELCTRLFGQDLKPSSAVRTDDIGEALRGRFSILDFPHWDSELDEISRSALDLHQGMLDAVIVLTRAEHGCDTDMERVKQVFEILKASYPMLQPDELPLRVFLNKADELLTKEIDKVNTAAQGIYDLNKAAEAKKAAIYAASGVWEQYKGRVIRNASRHGDDFADQLLPLMQCSSFIPEHQENGGARYRQQGTRDILEACGFGARPHLNTLWSVEHVGSWLKEMLQGTLGINAEDVQQLELPTLAAEQQHLW